MSNGSYFYCGNKVLKSVPFIQIILINDKKITNGSLIRRPGRGRSSSWCSSSQPCPFATAGSWIASESTGAIRAVKVNWSGCPNKGVGDSRIGVGCWDSPLSLEVSLCWTWLGCLQWSQEKRTWKGAQVRKARHWDDEIKPGARGRQSRRCHSQIPNLIGHRSIPALEEEEVRGRGPAPGWHREAKTAGVWSHQEGWNRKSQRVWGQKAAWIGVIGSETKGNRTAEVPQRQTGARNSTWDRKAKNIGSTPIWIWKRARTPERGRTTGWVKGCWGKEGGCKAGWAIKTSKTWGWKRGNTQSWTGETRITKTGWTWSRKEGSRGEESSSSESRSLKTWGTTP